FVFFIFLSSFSYANDDKLYRADSRPPDEIKQSGGLMPRGQSEYFDRGTQMNINLYDHARGTQTGFVRHDDGYVSTSISLRSAHLVGQTILSGHSTYYIYVIATAPNMFNVNDVLGAYSPHPDEQEVSALGGIPYSQIYGWYRVHFGVLDEQLHRNRGYRDRYYSNLDIAPAADGYGLAGFPPEHRAWREEPWIHHAPPGCGNAPRSSMSNTCDEKTQSLGVKFLDEYQSKVKRQIFSGYQSDIDTHNRIKDEL
ncbi:TPA: cholera enterotoxin catalytic subunit CtxA, partial [Vibrio cholerae]|nr:cholera enterotoxin catalytic subunit CtxA [Vibrio cholerae]HAS3858732.1 cholera enterotoxin catalytic subunit CtxA [Vibrio cholerae]HAS7420361.1 cholera enterotoxin catalytic subunit CtxA [Vibrio cholerae]HAS7511809.1 cholera enterotoxin catalytic subunit CtxA [Vibrio cholerae]HBN6837657.1 cholera enterotoxin catalytic subunit CtxA [Vibrio cholerae]